MKNVLSLNNIKAKEFFLDEDSYFTFDLPKYFTFNKLLNKISKILEDKQLSDFYDNKNKPEYSDNVNYKLLNNKNGEYSWRMFQLIHPALYVSLVHKITEKNNWSLIVKRIKHLQKDSFVKCVSYPIIKTKKEKSNRSKQILFWWEEVEQKSIELGLDYDYIFHTDIVSFYDSIYTHSVSWALHTKEVAKDIKNRNNNNLIGVVIDKHLQRMSNGQTNGIPQGSILMDFIAEILLSYADNQLTKKLKEAGFKSGDLRIIRYRDDYRIFVNNPANGKEVIKNITLVLSDLGMKLGSEKTKYLDSVIYGAIKEDKLFWIENSKISRKLHEELFVISKLAEKYPNSGTLIKELQNFYNRVKKRKRIYQNIYALISILIDTTFKNPRTYPVSSALLSKFVSFLKTNKERKEIIEKIKKKFEKLPNTEHLDLWLQRITLKLNGGDEYYGLLCKKVLDKNIVIWNSDWLTKKIEKIISTTDIINKKEIENMNYIIDAKEVSVFEQKSNY